MFDALHPADGDQAAGLRRLLGSRAPQVIAFVSGREACGRTSLLVQTTAALAQGGREIVVIDENTGPNNVLSTFGVASRYDLLDLVQSGRSVLELMHAAMPRVRVIAASRFAEQSSNLDAVSVECLNSGLQQIQQGASFVLIDCATKRDGQVSPLALAAKHMVVVVAAQGPAITHAYALIKRLVRECGRDGFEVVITRARSEAEAKAIFDNLRQTARQHLGVRLGYLGGARVPATDHLADALQSRLPPSAGESDYGGFRQFEVRPAPRRSAPGVAPSRLESVV